MNRPPRKPARAADNPFASHRIESLPPRGQGLDPATLAGTLDSLGGRAAIVGRKGSGKTTVLEAMARWVGDAALLTRIPGHCPKPWRTLQRQLPPGIDSAHRVFVDGGEQLGAAGWRRLLWRTRGARSLVVTQHRPGRLPTLVTCASSPALLRDLVADLAPDGDFARLESCLDDLLQRHDGNIRLCLRDLYDLYAGRVEPRATRW